LVKKGFLAVLVAILLTGFLGVSALADEITDIQNQYDQIQGKIDNLNEEKGSLEDEIYGIKKQVNAVDATIASTDQEISSMQVKINVVQTNIENTTKELNAAILEYNKQDDNMKKRINALYKNGTSVGYLQVILEASSFSDFITRADIMKKIVDYDINMLKVMKEKRDEIDKKKAELEGNKTELVALKKNLDSKKQVLVGQKKEKSDMVALLSRKVSTLNYNIDQEEATANKLLRELSAMKNKYTGNYDGSKWAILRRSDFPSGYSPRITSDFGYRVDPITGSRGAYHSGMDIGTGGLRNRPVYAMAPGKVVLAEWYGGYGNAVVIDHGGGLMSLYGHNNSLVVSYGDIVLGGQQIAFSGSTGRSTGPHVHFGVQKNGEYIDPSTYLLIGN